MEYKRWLSWNWLVRSLSTVDLVTLLWFGFRRSLLVDSFLMSSELLEYSVDLQYPLVLHL